MRHFLTIDKNSLLRLNAAQWLLYEYWNEYCSNALEFRLDFGRHIWKVINWFFTSHIHVHVHVHMAPNPTPGLIVVGLMRKGKMIICVRLFIACYSSNEKTTHTLTQRETQRYTQPKMDVITGIIQRERQQWLCLSWVFWNFEFLPQTLFIVVILSQTIRNTHMNIYNEWEKERILVYRISVRNVR